MDQFVPVELSLWFPWQILDKKFNQVSSILSFCHVNRLNGYGGQIYMCISTVSYPQEARSKNEQNQL